MLFYHRLVDESRIAKFINMRGLKTKLLCGALDNSFQALIANKIERAQTLFVHIPLSLRYSGSHSEYRMAMKDPLNL